MRLTSPSIPLLCAALGCGPTVSLDDPDAAGSSGTSTGAGPFGVLSATADEDTTLGVLDDGPRLDLSDAKLDVAPDLPLPPGSCRPDCQRALDRVWAHDGFADGAPLDPEDHVAVIVGLDRGFTVAEERQGEHEEPNAGGTSDSGHTAHRRGKHTVRGRIHPRSSDTSSTTISSDRSGESSSASSTARR